MEAAMRMIIEARIVSHTGTGKVISLADIERVDGDLKQLGLNLSEGRDLMHDVQHALVNAQTNTFVEASTRCRHCHAELSIKAMHTIQYKTVYGKVTIDSPQLRRCKCKQSKGVGAAAFLTQGADFDCTEPNLWKPILNNSLPSTCAGH
jgi:hypothetical protein